MPGDQIVVIPTPFGKLGLAVCYNLRFPEMFRLMVKQGVEIIALPSDSLLPLGLRTGMFWYALFYWKILSYVLAACQTGIHANYAKPSDIA